jgi:hypothetical protein
MSRGFITPELLEFFIDHPSLTPDQKVELQEEIARMRDEPSEDSATPTPKPPDQNPHKPSSADEGKGKSRSQSKPEKETAQRIPE